MQVNDLIKEKVLSELKESILEFLIGNEVKIDDCRVRIEYSRDEKFGNYSSPFAMENKNLFGKAPLEIAKSLTDFLERRNQVNSFFSEITCTAPGFINFRVSQPHLLSFVNKFILRNDPFVKLDKSKKINLEFVSANPTGPLNIVSARACAYGDSLAKLLLTLGHSLDREFYVNDYGNQVNLLGVACILRTKEVLGELISFQEEEDGRSIYELIEANILPKESYRGEYILDIVRSISTQATIWKEILTLIENKSWDDLISLFSLKAIESNLNGQKKDLQDFGVKFDRFFSERTLHESGAVMNSIENLIKTGDIFEEDGKKIFQSTKYGDDKDRVVIRDDGRPTYLLADIAYHINKMERGYDEIIDIWGPDHHGYIARLAGAMQSLGYGNDKFKVIICQQVNLIEDGKKVKMSKRLGNFQRMTDLIHYLGKSAKDVGRYFFTTRTAEAPLDFDLDLAKDESDKNPVFYLQYAHARISSIFREVGSEYSNQFNKDFEWTDDRLTLLFWVARFSEEVYDAALNREPHRIATYLQSLAKHFTRFYGNKLNRLKDCDEITRLNLAYLCKVTQITLQQGLGILGIDAPDRMDKQ
ncbi:MAG: arginine--tRNA ligase [Leptospiraceae bacterium]|nr:arginine--tRNA ligase [Leptospiraceae bacterium]MCZ8348070.1 arginine--tRNA ligase [Leptospiraceae bacterium]